MDDASGDVVGGDVQSPFEDGSSLGSDHQVLSGPGSGTPGDVGFHELRRVRFGGPSGSSQIAGVDEDVFGHRHLSDQLLQLKNLLPGQSGFELGHLVDQLADDPEATATAVLGALSKHPASAYGHTKAALHAGTDRTTEDEEAAFIRDILPAWTSSAIKSTIAAFLGK